MIDFISRPLLKSDSIYREIRAVNSEHQMNKNRDVRRKWQIFYSGLLMSSYLINYVKMTLFDLPILKKNFEEKNRKFRKFTPKNIFDSQWAKLYVLKKLQILTI